MIYVTRLNHTSVLLNSELIEYVETTPDTVISLTTGQKLMVLESPEDIVGRIIQFRRSIFSVDPGKLMRSAGGPEATLAESGKHGG
jgi:flagellar protein FlbD